MATPRKPAELTQSIWLSKGMMFKFCVIAFRRNMTGMQWIGIRLDIFRLHDICLTFTLLSWHIHVYSMENWICIWNFVVKQSLIKSNIARNTWQWCWAPSEEQSTCYVWINYSEYITRERVTFIVPLTMWAKSHRKPLSSKYLVKSCHVHGDDKKGNVREITVRGRKESSSNGKLRVI